jgi:hypothetical protein
MGEERTIQNLKAKELKARERTGLKYLAGAFGVLLVAIGLNFWKPLWLPSPWLRWTPLSYGLLLLAWWPLLIISLNQSSRRRPALSALLLLSLALIQCICSLTLAGEDLGYLTLYGEEGHPVLGGGFYCRPVDETALNCDLCIMSSDHPSPTRKSYTFRRLEPLPVLYLVEMETVRSTREQPVSCPAEE